MKKKIIISAIMAALVLSLGACGRPEKDDSSSVSGGSAYKSGKVNGYRMETDISEVGDNDDLSALTGCFIESTDGNETGYVSINENGAVYVKKGEIGTMPLGIESSNEGLMIYRVSKTPVDKYVPYTFDGKTLKFENYAGAFEWQKVDYFQLEGTYQYSKEDGSGSERWTFNSDGTGTAIKPGQQEAQATDFTFTQDKDKVVMKSKDGKETEYTYMYDKATLVLESEKKVYSLTMAP